MTQGTSDGAVFTARRSLWAIILNLVLGLLLTALTIANLVHQVKTGGSWAVSVMFAIIALFFLWQAWAQLRDRSPVIEVGPAGLRLPLASAEAIPWSRIRHVHLARGIPGLGGGRVDFMVDIETFARLKFGQRFMGDIVVKKRGAPNAFSLITPQLEESASAIFAAIQRYWPAKAHNEE
jgi:hypothetical protein